MNLISDSTDGREDPEVARGRLPGLCHLSRLQHKMLSENEGTGWETLVMNDMIILKLILELSIRIGNGGWLL
jgi:hypothetical protein